MKKLILASLVISIGVAVQWSAPAQEQDSYQVIVNSANPTTSLPKGKVSRYFLKRVTKWDDGTLVQPVDLGAKSGIRNAFSKAVHGRSASSIKSYWQRQIFSGNGVPPAELGTDDEVVAFVKGDPGGIGYVSSGTTLDGVKAIEVTDGK